MTRKALTPLVLPANPVAAMEAAPKQYVDNRSRIVAALAAIGGGPWGSSAYAGIASFSYAFVAGRRYVLDGWAAGYNQSTTSADQLSIRIMINGVQRFLAYMGLGTSDNFTIPLGPIIQDGGAGGTWTVSIEIACFYAAGSILVNGGTLIMTDEGLTP